MLDTPKPIQPSAHRFTLPPMTHEASFISHALRCISEAVVDILGRTELHVRPNGLSQRLAQRTRAQLKALEQMLRRVIMLIAIGLSKDYVSVPRAKPRIRVLGGLSRPKPMRTPKRRNLGKEPAPHLPSLASVGCGDVDFSALPKDKRRKPVNLRKLINRIRTLQAVLENPEPMARRLAIHYARLKALHVEALPVPPEIPLKRPGAELSLVSGALSMEIARATRAWNDSG